MTVGLAVVAFGLERELLWAAFAALIYWLVVSLRSLNRRDSGAGSG